MKHSYLKHNRDVILVACRTYGMVWKDEPLVRRYYKTDVELVKQACRQNGLALQYLSEEYRSNEQIVITAIRSQPESIKFALNGLNQNKDCLIAAGIWDENYDDEDGNDDETKDPSSTTIVHRPDDIGDSGSRDESGNRSSSSSSNSRSIPTNTADAPTTSPRTGHRFDVSTSPPTIIRRRDTGDSGGGRAVDRGRRNGNNGSPSRREGSSSSSTQVRLEDDDGPKMSAAATTSKLMSTNHPTRIVLSTRFALNETSSFNATQFTIALKKHPYFSSSASSSNGMPSSRHHHPRRPRRRRNRDRAFAIYSPNAFNKATCDPQWTRYEWPCRGTKETCQRIKVVPTKKKKRIERNHDGDDDEEYRPFLPDADDDYYYDAPTNDCCWRCSFRYQLEQARRTNGFMIQVVDYVPSGKGSNNGTSKKGRKKLDLDKNDECCNDPICHDLMKDNSTASTSSSKTIKDGYHELGDAQEIEIDMAQSIPIKVFRIYQPTQSEFYVFDGGSRPFQSTDIDQLVDHIEQWYKDTEQKTQR